MELGTDGGDLLLEAPAPAARSVLDLLSRRKAGVVALLRSGWDGWSAEDWWVFFDERAGIAEFNAGLPRACAEAFAFACCIDAQPCAPPAWPLRCLRRRSYPRAAAALRH